MIKKVTQAQFRADPSKWVARANVAPVIVTDAEGKSVTTIMGQYENLDARCTCK